MSSQDTRHDIYSLGDGRQFVVTYPADTTAAEADEFGEWLKLIVRKVARRAAVPAALLGEPGSGNYAAAAAALARAVPARGRLVVLPDEPNGATPADSDPPAHEVGGVLPAPKPKPKPAEREGEVAGKAAAPGLPEPLTIDALLARIGEAKFGVVLWRLTKQTGWEQRRIMKLMYAHRALFQMPHSMNQCVLLSDAGRARLGTSTPAERPGSRESPEAGGPGTEPMSPTPTERAAA